jgi:Nucleotidyltransferase of unknown function (DUF6036)
VSEGHDLSLTREQIIGLLAELGQELDARGVKAQLFVVGGAAMALAYNMRRTTADVDGVFEPKAVYLLALKVQAARIDRDQDDIRFLARETGAKTADDVLRIAEQVIGGNRLLPKAQFIVQEMFPEDPAEPSLP